MKKKRQEHVVLVARPSTFPLRSTGCLRGGVEIEVKKKVGDTEQTMAVRAQVVCLVYGLSGSHNNGNIQLSLFDIN